MIKYCPAPRSEAYTHRLTPVSTHLSFRWTLPLMGEYRRCPRFTYSIVSLMQRQYVGAAIRTPIKHISVSEHTMKLMGEYRRCPRFTYSIVSLMQRQYVGAAICTPIKHISVSHPYNEINGRVIQGVRASPSLSCPLCSANIITAAIRTPPVGEAQQKKIRKNFLMVL
jgi:hypothetical protein